MNEALLSECLALAVPIAIRKLWARGGPSDDDWEWARESAWTLGSDGDKLLFRSKKKGETAALFADFAQALAIMAFVPGGVKFLGHHWQVYHDD